MNESTTTRYAIGADIGGSHICSAVVDLETGRLCTEPVTTPVDSGAAAGEIIGAWCRNLAETAAASPVKESCAGMAIPGPFDYRNGVSLIKGVSKFESIYGLDVAMSIRSRLVEAGIDEIKFVNDASAFALGEALGGAARESRSVMALTLGTGVGSGFVNNRRLVESGDTVPANGWVYSLPFEDGQADDAFSTRWICKRYRELTGETVDSAKVVADRCIDDARARQLFCDFGVRLARFAMPLLERFGSHTLLLGGNISRAYPMFGPSLEDEIARAGKDIDVKVSALLDKAALVGAASLFVDNSL